jgi:NADP-dependent 3-hydroxy acid dehydrogenase YdfG
MENFFKDKVVLVSGQAGTLSMEIIHSFLKEMAVVIFPAKSLHQIEMIKSFSDINRYENFITLLIDVQDFDKVKETCETITDRFGKFDISIQIPEFSRCKKRLTEASIDEWNNMTETEMVPFFMGARIVLNMMKGNLSSMFVHISDSTLFENLKSNALTRIAFTTKMEMSKIFAEEAHQHGIRYYHLWLQDLSGNQMTDTNIRPTQSSATLISQEIKDLYRKENYSKEMALQSFPSQLLHQQI